MSVVDNRTPEMLRSQNKQLQHEVKLLREIVWSIVYRQFGGRMTIPPPLDPNFKHQLVTTTDESGTMIIEAK